MRNTWNFTGSIVSDAGVSQSSNFKHLFLLPLSVSILSNSHQMTGSITLYGAPTSRTRAAVNLKAFTSHGLGCSKWRQNLDLRFVLLSGPNQIHVSNPHKKHSTPTLCMADASGCQHDRPKRQPTHARASVREQHRGRSGGRTHGWLRRRLRWGVRTSLARPVPLRHAAALP